MYLLVYIRPLKKDSIKDAAKGSRTGAMWTVVPLKGVPGPRQMLLWLQVKEGMEVPPVLESSLSPRTLDVAVFTL